MQLRLVTISFQTCFSYLSLVQHFLLALDPSKIERQQFGRWSTKNTVIPPAMTTMPASKLTSRVVAKRQFQMPTVTSSPDSATTTNFDNIKKNKPV